MNFALSKPKSFLDRALLLLLSHFFLSWHAGRSEGELLLEERSKRAETAKTAAAAEVEKPSLLPAQREGQTKEDLMNIYLSIL